MDKTTRNVAALGLLTIIAIVVFFWGLYYLLGNEVLRGGMDVHVQMANGGGLKRGDRVLYQGVLVGSVKDMRLLGREGVSAVVHLNDKLPLPADTRAVVSGDVFGAHEINLMPGNAMVHLQSGDTLRGEVAPPLMATASGLTGRATSVLNRADSLLSYQTIANLQATTAALPGSAVQLRAALAELRGASAALRRTAEGIESAKTAQQLNTAIARIDQGAQSITIAANSLNTSIVSLQSVFGKIDRGEGSLGRLINDTSLYANLNGAARGIRALSEDIKANPKKYLDIRIF